MKVKWKNGFNPEIVLQKMSKIRTLDGENVAFSGFEYHEYISVLKSMIRISEDMPTVLAHSLIAKGFHNAAKRRSLTKENVISAIKTSVREHFAKPSRHYRLVTTLNISTKNNIPRYVINRCALRFYRELPKKYLASRKELLAMTSAWLIEKDEPESYYGHLEKFEICGIWQLRLIAPSGQA